MLPPSQVENDFEGDDGSAIPPPDIRRAVDGTARFVASIDPWFEKRMIANKSGMHKYSFLYDGDPYNTYYKRRVSEFRAQNGSTLSADGDDPFRPKWLTRLSDERTREILKRFERSAAVMAARAVSVVSPITGELIPNHKMYQHMRTYTADPKYKEQKETLFAKVREIAPSLGTRDELISICVAGLARTRPDVFRASEEEFLNAVKAEFESIDIVIDLDGHTATQAEDGGVTDLTSTPPTVNPPPLMPQGTPEEPEPKRQWLDDFMHVPEDQFLAQHPGPACISVWVPEKGQMLEISVESTSESVSSLKEKIAGEIKVPASKQKLSGNRWAFSKTTYLLLITTLLVVRIFLCHGDCYIALHSIIK